MDIVEEIRQDREIGAKRLASEYQAGLLALACRFCHDPGDAEGFTRGLSPLALDEKMI